MGVQHVADLAELVCKLYMGAQLFDGELLSILVDIGGCFTAILEEEDVESVVQQFLLHAEMAGP